MAEAVFGDMTKTAGLNRYFEIASAGTSGYHVGDGPCRGTREILAKHNIEYRGRSQRITPQDLNYFDYILAMDADNLAGLKFLDRHGRNRHKFYLLLEFSAQNKDVDVPDPYYVRRFEYVFKLIQDGCQGLLTHLRQAHNIKGD